MSSAVAPVMVDAQDLAAAVARVFAALGIVADDAAAVAQDLVAADLEGVASHGVMLVPMYVERLLNGSVSRAREGVVVGQSGGAVVIDAGDALGQLTARQAVRVAVSGAREHGLAAAAVRNAFHFGAAGRYARMMADQGCVGIVMSNTRPLMPAPGGAEALTGNNPLAIALPGAGENPVEVDMALSATAMGRIRLAASAGETIPDGWATDRDGNPTTDPAEAIKGMLLPAAGPKGFGLAFMIDLICGGLSDGAIGPEVRPLYGDAAQPYRCSHFFLAIDVGHFVAPDRFGARVRERPIGSPAPGALPGSIASMRRARSRRQRADARPARSGSPPRPPGT